MFSAAAHLARLGSAVVSALAAVLMAVLLDQTMIRFKPQVVMMPITPMSFLFYMAWTALCLLPPALEIIGAYRFRQLQQAAG